MRKFWIEHGIAGLKIAEYFGKELGTPCAVNFWVPDGFKDEPSDRFGPRKRLKESYDKIFKYKYNRKYCIPTIESKLFGIGVESCTPGSHEFYMCYAMKNNILCLLDTGHFHISENVADKISTLLLFSGKVAFHVSRGVRWDSDRVVLLEDELKQIALAIVRNDAVNEVLIGLDYFDASINRIGAWVTGQRSMEKALLYALLQPHDALRARKGQRQRLEVCEKDRAKPRHQKRPVDHGVALVPRQPIVGEHGVAGIAQSGQHAQTDARPRGRETRVRARKRKTA